MDKPSFARAAAGNGEAGEDVVVPVAEGAEHGCGFGRVTRFAENGPVQFYIGVGGDDEGIGKTLQCGVGFEVRKTLNHGRRGLVVGMGFVGIG